ncbi:MAG: aspartyl/asparaginyl beta-hydroxylase domain-containing protein [Spirochaetes bacterium]|nr:aspartyl/asparaginyl beta-hydroxylase domain-containing protein [Spirochaetota bacterium]
MPSLVTARAFKSNLLQIAIFPSPKKRSRKLLDPEHQTNSFQICMPLRPDRLWFAIKDEEEIEEATEYVLSTESVPHLKLIEEKMPLIRKEYAEVKQRTGLFTPYFQENISSPPGSWDTIPLCVFELKRGHSRLFPGLMAVLNEVPGLIGCFISRLKPQSSISRHSGITNGIFRCQIALDLPSDLPEVTGFSVADATTRLYEDRFISFVDANAHWAWNRAEADRVILIVDIIRPQFRYLRYYISARITFAYIVLVLSEKKGLGLLGRFLSTKISRYILNVIAIPTVPVFFLLTKINNFGVTRFGKTFKKQDQ